MLFPLLVADEGNNATVPRSKKAKEKCEAPAGLFGHRKRVPMEYIAIILIVVFYTVVAIKKN